MTGKTKTSAGYGKLSSAINRKLESTALLFQKENQGLKELYNLIESQKVHRFEAVELMTSMQKFTEDAQRKITAMELTLNSIKNAPVITLYHKQQLADHLEQVEIIKKAFGILLERLQELEKTDRKMNKSLLVFAEKISLSLDTAARTIKRLQKKQEQKWS